MPKKDSISDEDRALFRDSVKGTKRMEKSNRHTLPPPSSKQRPKSKKQRKSTPSQPDESPEQPDWSDGTEQDWITADTILSYKKTGVNERDMRNLRTGKIPVQATLDLHGSTVDEARWQLNQFIQHHSLAHRVCVCIIHGKGLRGGDYPVLKSKINVWLRQVDSVVAFHSAPPKLGGTGAVLVLLK